MSVYCGKSFGGGQGYTDTCGKEVYGKGTPLAQCAGCAKEEISQLKAENEVMAKRLLFVDIVHGPKAEMRWAVLVKENESLRNAVNIDIDAAAKMLAACMDYPWEHMPANGRDLMRRHAKDIVDAAISSPENP